MRIPLPQAPPPARLPRGRRLRAAAVLTLVLALALTLGAQATAAPGDRTGTDRTRGYEVRGVGSAAQRSALAMQGGVAIDAVHGHSVTITADPATARKLEGLGYLLEELPAGRPSAAAADGAASALSTPSEYHSYSQTMAAVNALVSRHPGLMSSRVIGTSYQGRPIVAVKVSDNVGTDENEPEILFTHNMHAREHLTTEMALYLLDEFATEYGRDARLTRLLDTREVWIIPSVNPDGKVYDQDSGVFRSWRKNRQPNSGSRYIGTDINRNFAYRWGCCGGSSGSTSSATYRGSGPESAPETRVVTDFVRSRVAGGRQQVAAHIDFHSYSELILWPYGYTYSDTAPGLDQDARNAYAAVGQEMAASNGYRPQQSSDLYVTDGTINDWMWGSQGIWSYTFEMYPRSSSAGGFYPPGSVIDRETARNREAVLILMDHADCMYEAIGKPALCSS
ncbi:M14 family metallopeptidase [Streptomyces aidingensis]|uniref:Zinc carboxypeptidase n=1 Tax=Streptomyces aidingensis TaxID=910347 RepID=A0A1I1NWJ3_9ACTN|nr:M14 family metallopeptidase [Streptomyces aidingensis]SFD02061.1 Zinc carboxypeptidase [Streptomyces aidingensis]